MTGDQTAAFVQAGLCLLLLVSSLVARQLPLGATLKMIAAWVGIFAVLLAILAFRAEFATVGNRVYAELTGRGVSDGKTLRIQMSPDGHFWVTGSVDGAETRFLIDSGATGISLSMATAKAARLDDDFENLPVPIDTANGTVLARRTTIGTLQIGPIRREGLAAVAAPEFGETDVLGMNFLSSLSGWAVEGRWLILKP